MSYEKFIERYEDKVKELQILEILTDNLTEKGKEVYQEIKKWLVENLDKYLEAIGEIK